MAEPENEFRLGDPAEGDWVSASTFARLRLKPVESGWQLVGWPKFQWLALGLTALFGLAALGTYLRRGELGTSFSLFGAALSLSILRWRLQSPVLATLLRDPTVSALRLVEGELLVMRIILLWHDLADSDSSDIWLSVILVTPKGEFTRVAQQPAKRLARALRDLEVETGIPVEHRSPDGESFLRDAQARYASQARNWAP